MPKKDKEKKETPVEEVAEQTVETPVEETPEVPEVNPFEEKYNAEHDAHLRLAAEYDNFRKRTIKEKEASDAAYKKGVEMTMNELIKIFTALGVEIFGEVGEQFDPNLHNAVMHIENEELPENSLAAVFQKGFKIGDKVVRFAMVQVAN